MNEFFVKKRKMNATSQLPTTNKFWAAVGGASSTSSSSTFQTPHEGQELLIDLTDDNSPQVSGSTTGVVEKTVIKGNLGSKGSPKWSPNIVKQEENPKSKADQDTQKNISTGKPAQVFTIAAGKAVQSTSESKASLMYLVGKPKKPVPVGKPKVTGERLLRTLTDAATRQPSANSKAAKKQVKNYLKKLKIPPPGKKPNKPKKRNKPPPVIEPIVIKEPLVRTLTDTATGKPSVDSQPPIRQAAPMQIHNYPFAYRPAGIPMSMLMQQQQVQEEHLRQQQLFEQQQFEQQQFEQQQRAIQQLQMAEQASMQPLYPQQPIPEPNWNHPSILGPHPMTTPEWNQQQSLLGPHPMDPAFSRIMSGMNPTPPEYVPPTHPPADQTPNSNPPVDTTSEPREGSASPDFQTGQRLSAFKRLGPLTQPAKPKLTINLLFNKEQSVREVVDTTRDQPEVEPYVPVHLRPSILTSTDETVMKFLINWPWKKTVYVRRTVTAKNSKSAMLLEREQVEENYDKDNIYIQISVKGYPPTWQKEDVLDALLENVSIIPCFIEHQPQECKFLVIRSRMALLSIHKLGFTIHKDDVVLTLSISVLTMSLSHIDFIPRLVLRKRLAMAYDGEEALNLQSFTTKEDISHFIYFPLNCPSNQGDLVQMQSVVAWEHLTSLNLSHNRLTSIDRFHLQKVSPKLRHLDLSHNKFEKITALLRTRSLPLRSIKLEGNPLCYDYIDPAYYVKVVRLMYPGLREIDGVEIQLKGEFPKFHKNYCIHGAQHIVDKFLGVFFPLLDSTPGDRLLVEDLYDENALISVMYQYTYLMRLFRSKSIVSRYKDDGEKELLEGANAVTRMISKWPTLKHDPYTFTVDVVYHSDTTTIVTINGILKITSETLAEDEHVIAFTRTVTLRTRDGIEYKIRNELLYWHVPTVEYADSAFQINMIRPKRLSLEFESTPDDDLKEKLTAIFMKITELDKNASERCLEKKDWNLRNALDYFIQLLKLDDLQSLGMDASVNSK